MPRSSTRKKRSGTKKSRKIVGKPNEEIEEELRRKQRNRRRMRELAREYGYLPLSEDPVQDPTVQSTRDEIAEWQARYGLDAEDPFAVTDLARYYPAGEPEGQYDETIYELYGVLGRAPARSTAISSRQSTTALFLVGYPPGRRSDSDCFGTSLLTLASLRERIRCPIPMLGVTNVETIESCQVNTFLEKQRGMEIFPMRTDSVWRSKWSRARGKRSLGRYLEDAKYVLKLDSPPLFYS